MMNHRQTTSSLVTFSVLSIVAIIPFSNSNAALATQAESAFAKRMMTMDRNKDGYLTAEEIPKSLLKGIMDADLNKDGKWTAKELSTVSMQAMKDRADTSAAAGNTKVGNRRQNRSGRGRLGRGPARPDTGPGSPLDAAQILKFALTFDIDKDSGLNPDELRRYASALAKRRSAARRQRESESAEVNKGDRGMKKPSAIPLPEVPDRSAPAKNSSGLKSKSNSRDADPFGSGKND